MALQEWNPSADSSAGMAGAAAAAPSLISLPEEVE